MLTGLSAAPLPCRFFEHSGAFSFFFFEDERLHVRHTVVKSLAEGQLEKKLAPEREERIKHKIGAEPSQHYPKRTPETNPEREREEPHGTPYATGPALHREWPIWDVDVVP